MFRKGAWPAGRREARGHVRRPSHTRHMQVSGRLAGTRRQTDGHREQVRSPAGAGAVRSRNLSKVSCSCDAAVSGHPRIMEAAHAVVRHCTRAQVIRIRNCPCYLRECIRYCGATFWQFIVSTPRTSRCTRPSRPLACLRTPWRGGRQGEATRSPRSPAAPLASTHAVSHAGCASLPIRVGPQVCCALLHTYAGVRHGSSPARPPVTRRSCTCCAICCGSSRMGSRSGTVSWWVLWPVCV